MCCFPPLPPFVFTISVPFCKTLIGFKKTIADLQLEILERRALGGTQTPVSADLLQLTSVLAVPDIADVPLEKAVSPSVLPGKVKGP